MDKLEKNNNIVITIMKLYRWCMQTVCWHRLYMVCHSCAWWNLLCLHASTWILASLTKALHDLSLLRKKNCIIFIPWLTFLYLDVEMIHYHPKLCSSKWAQPIIDAWLPWFNPLNWFFFFYCHNVAAWKSDNITERTGESQFHFFALMNHLNIQMHDKQAWI